MWNGVMKLRATSPVPKQVGFLRRLARDRTGNTLAIMASGIIPLIAMVGGAVDMSRAYLASSRLQQACDAGVEVIVVDHHKCAAELPSCVALVNPNRLDESDEAASFGHLAAVGVAFLLALKGAVEAGGGRVRFQAASARVRRILERAGVGALLYDAPVRFLSGSFAA